MKLGDFVKKFLKPFVKGTKFENCDECEKRRIVLNKWSDYAVTWFNKLTCPCFYRKLWHKFLS